MWVLIFTTIILAFEGVYVIKYVTRFTEEIFAFLIASVFFTDAVKKIYSVSFFIKISILFNIVKLFYKYYRYFPLIQ